MIGRARSHTALNSVATDRCNGYPVHMPAVESQPPVVVSLETTLGDLDMSKCDRLKSDAGFRGLPASISAAECHDCMDFRISGFLPVAVKAIKSVILNAMLPAPTIRIARSCRAAG